MPETTPAQRWQIARGAHILWAHHRCWHVVIALDMRPNLGIVGLMVPCWKSLCGLSRASIRSLRLTSHDGLRAPICRGCRATLEQMAYFAPQLFAKD